MNIRARILLLVAASFVALLTVGALSMVQARRSEREVRFVTETVVPSALKSVALLTRLKDVHIAAMNMVAAPDEATTRQSYEEVTRRRAALRQAVEELAAQSDSQAQRGLVEVVQESLKNYDQSLDDTAKFALAGQREIAQANMAATVDQYLREQGEALNALDIEKNRSKDVAIKGLNERLSATLVLLGTVTLAAVAFLGVIGFMLYRRIVAPIGEMQASMTRIAQTQDFSHRVPVTRHDEIGKSMQAFNLMIEKIEEGAALVRRKTADIHAILDNIPQGILAIDAQGLVHPEVSQHLAVVLERDDSAGQPAAEVLFDRSSLSADERSQVEAAIVACLGEDMMNFEFNAHLLPAEIEMAMEAGRVKILDLNWAPIVGEQDTVERLLVCVRDVTELRALARAAEAQRRELVLIGEILAVRPDKFQAFCDDAASLIDQAVRAVAAAHEGEETDRADAVHQLFRHLHTVKGNARMHGLLQLADVAHQVEDHYDQLRSGRATWNTDLLLHQLDGVRSALEDYRVLSEEKLGRGAAHRVERAVASDTSAAVDPSPAAATLAQLLAPVLQSLPDLAAQLGKEPPQVNIDDADLHLNPALGGTLRNAFIHLCRNAMDHGLEPTLERIAAGKRAAGQIALQMVRADGQVRLMMVDDGRGLALHRIQARAIERGLISEGAVVTPAALAELVFAPGFSTADQVSEVSGRGVGMDAVRAYLAAVDGEIRIELAQDAVPASGYVGFRTVISLPERAVLAPDVEDSNEVVTHA